MSTRMAGLQKQLPDSIKLISFSVDPQHDTPAALLAYSEKYEAQAGRWTFLTGEPKAALAVVAGMKLGFLPATATDPIVHSSYFVLVDGTGKVRGAYDSNIDNRVADLIHDTKLLADENSAGNGAAK
jgi:protein SCO1/2